MSVRLSESLVTTGPLADAFSDAAIIGAMLRFEIALARAEALLGVIPAEAAGRIERTAAPEAIDAAAIAAAARHSGTMAIAFVEQLRSRVDAGDPAAAAFVHWGATSQDVSDTALILCLGHAQSLLWRDHDRLASGLRRLSNEHAGTAMLGRTLLQPAGPITFGLKAAGWFGAVTRCAVRLRAAFDEAIVLQFGGATGTLAALGDRGIDVGEQLARELDLPVPDAPWHSHRDRLAALVAACGIYTGALGKIARDISLLMQFEVGEVAEPGGGSSTMPHKRNPAGCAIALAAAGRMPGLVATYLSGMPQEHERGVGEWHLEWSTLAAVVQTTGSALAAIADVIGALSVDRERMRANIDKTHGAIFAERASMLLASKVGREAASQIVAQALQRSRDGGQSFAAAISSSAEAAAALTSDELDSLESPEAYLGSAETFRRRLLDETE